jgi:hypothetical protein
VIQRRCYWISIIFLIFCLVICIAGCDNNSEGTVSVQNDGCSYYNSPTYNYSFEYPASWEFEVETPEKIFIIPEDSESVLLVNVGACRDKNSMLLSMEELATFLLNVRSRGIDEITLFYSETADNEHWEWEMGYCYKASGVPLFSRCYIQRLNDTYYWMECIYRLDNPDTDKKDNDVIQVDKVVDSFRLPVQSEITYKHYINELYHYSFDYPSEWIINSDNISTVLIFPYEKRNNTFAFVNVDKVSYMGDDVIDKWIEQFVFDYNYTFEKFTLISADAYDGTEWQRQLECSFSLEDTDYQMTGYVQPVDDYVYLFAICNSVNLASDSRVEVILSELQKSFNSFKFE